MKRFPIILLCLLAFAQTGFSTNHKHSIPEFNIENDAVADYIAHTTSNLSATPDMNYGKAFFNQSWSFRPDQPRTMAINFSGKPGSIATVQMSERKDMSSPVLESEVTLGDDGTGSYILRNMVPGKTYYYKVSASRKVLTKGAFLATGQVRMIAIDKGFNIRDLGGWTGLEGNKIRYERIYRGGSLGGTDMNGNASDIPAEDKAELQRIGIRAQLDLRAATNSGLYDGEYSLHSYSRGATTLLDADFNNTMTDYGAYNGDNSVIADVAWIIYELKQGKPVYYNCRQGADRTGTVSFMIEGLLGCYGSDSGRQMGMDYELTGFSQANLIDNISVGSSYRGATEAYGNTRKLFRQLLDLTADGEKSSSDVTYSSAESISLNDVHEKCYYYLNQLIDKDDLDWFINYMLGVTDLEGNLTPGHSSKISCPAWAKKGDDLKTIAESMSNVITML